VLPTSENGDERAMINNRLRWSPLPPEFARVNGAHEGRSDQGGVRYVATAFTSGSRGDNHMGRVMPDHDSEFVRLGELVSGEGQ
jgi:hypothetical protein